MPIILKAKKLVLILTTFALVIVASIEIDFALDSRFKAPFFNNFTLLLKQVLYIFCLIKFKKD